MEFQTYPGLVSFKAGLELQEHFVAQRIADHIQDTVLFLEHEPTYTRGRGQQNGLKPTHNEPDMIEINRGGGTTYHGPGQLVLYPIFKLNHKNIHHYLRWLESTIIQSLSNYGLDASRRPQATGVWVGKRKIASIGIGVRKWVTFHGAALNARTSLQAFQIISPCGFSPDVMTSLTDLGVPLGDSWRAELEAHVRTSFLSQAGNLS